MRAYHRPGAPLRTVGRARFEELAARDFERLSFAFLLATESWRNDEIDWYGQLGGDDGADIWGVHADGRTHAYQCANHQKLKVAKIKTDIDKIFAGPNGVPKRFTAIVGGYVSATGKREIVAYAKKKGVKTAAVWGGVEFEERLRIRRPDLLRRLFLGEEFPDDVHALQDLVASDVSTIHMLPESIGAAFAALEARKSDEAKRAAACDAARRRRDFSLAQKLLDYELFPVREDAYLLLKEHIRCKHRGALGQLLMRHWRRLTQGRDRDRCEILLLCGWAQTWSYSTELLRSFRACAATAPVSLRSAFQGFFHEAIRQHPAALRAILDLLREISEGAVPDQPTSTLLTLVQYLVRDRSPILAVANWEQIALIEAALRPEVKRFSQLVDLRRALEG